MALVPGETALVVRVLEVIALEGQGLEAVALVALVREVREVRVHNCRKY